MIRAFDDDTIVAISTPPGEGGIGVVRLSGKSALAAADVLFRAKAGVLPSRQKNFSARYGHVVFDDGAIIDEALVLVMRAPKSYTGEDVVEISAHGGTAVLAAIVRAALKAGARPAQPGEFTKRAFLNGRLDLVQAEAVLDLIEAKTDLTRGWAAAQLKGALSGKLKDIKNELVECLSHLEAAVDFPDDSPDTETPARIAERLKRMDAFFENLLKGSELGILAKRGFSAVITGRPNVGKSSLMNRLVRADRVIVTPHPGTTRDVVEETFQIKGIPVRLLDTAGIQASEHPIEKEGIERSKQAIAAADLVLNVVDGSRPLEAEDLQILNLSRGKRRIVVLNKSDLPQKTTAADFKKEDIFEAVRTSCLLEEGVNELEESIFRLATQGHAASSEEPTVTSVRQRDLLERLRGHLSHANKACEEGLSPEFISVDIRAALDDLGQLVGEAVNDDMLEALFSRFCIGK